MPDAKSKMGSKSLKKNAFYSLIRQVCSVGFSLITFTYASRILGKQAMGGYAFSKSIADYLLLISCLGIPIYAVREGAKVRNDNKKINEFFSEMFSINLLVSLLTLVIVVIVGVCNEKLENYHMIFSVQCFSIWLTVFGADWINTIYEDFLYIMVRYIVIQIISLLSLIIFVKDEKDLLPYTIIMLFSAYGGNILNFFYIRKYVRLRLTWKLRLNRHIVPILILFCNSVASTIYLNSDITILGYLTSEEDVGVYTLSSKIYAMIKTVFNAVIMITVPRFSNYISEKKDDKYRKDITEIINALLLIVIPSSVGMCLEAEGIIMLIGGESYLSGVSTLQILSAASVFAIAACVLSYVYFVPNNKDETYFVSTLIAAIANLLLNLIAIPVFGLNGAAMTTLIAEALICLYLYHKLPDKKLFHIKKNAVIFLFKILIGEVLVCLIVNLLIRNVIIRMFAACAVSVLVIFILLGVEGRLSRIFDYIKKHKEGKVN